MNSCALLVGLLSVLSLPVPAYAAREVLVGNEPLQAGFGYSQEVLAVANVEERVFLSDHNGDVSFYFKGGPKALNDALRRFVAIPGVRHEIILLPPPAKPLEFGKKPIPYDWCLYVPAASGSRRKARVPAERKATLTVYIPEPLPPTLADAAAARRWIADLGSDDFKSRERAAKELAALGPPVAALLREALRAGPTPEARDRLEKLLAGLSRDIRVDVLELPAGVPVVSLDDLLAKTRKALADKDPVIRGNAASALIEHGAPAEEVLPDIERMLKTEDHGQALAGAGWAAYRLGAAARPLLPLLRAAAKKVDKDIASIFVQAIDHVEKAKAEPVPEAEARRRAVIRKGIREFLAGRTPPAGK